MALLLDPLFSPKSVAVIGASANQDRTGYKFTHELLMRFPGKVFPINPKGGEVDGRPMYKSMAEAGEPADLALILVRKAPASNRRWSEWPTSTGCALWGPTAWGCSATRRA